MTKIKDSYWGKVQSCDSVLIEHDGITYECFSVATAGHGGLMIPKPLAKAMIPREYLHRDFVHGYGSFMCFEEDCEWAFALISIPELIALFSGAPDFVMDAAKATVAYYTAKSL